MKFYKHNRVDYLFFYKIIDNKLNAVYQNMANNAMFFKNGIRHNSKNTALIFINGRKEFILNNRCYGNQNDFTKQSWRRFVKLQVFL
jgi:hypothetical protein